MSRTTTATSVPATRLRDTLKGIPPQNWTGQSFSRVAARGPKHSSTRTYDESLRCSLTAKIRSVLNMKALKSHRRRVLRPFRFLANGRSFFGSATVPLVAAGTAAAALLMGIAGLAVLKPKSQPRKLKKARSRVESKKVFLVSRRGPGVRFAHRAAA